ncbi:MAG: hypothetical protein Q9214_004876 [Letrouitia sp. 1 TL-2023]
MKLLYTNNTFLYSSEKPPQKWPGAKKISKGSGFEDVWDEDEDKFALLIEFVDYVIVENMQRDVATNGLKQLILTGLPENDLGLFIVKAFSLLTRKRGRIGIGTGEGGKRYQLIHEKDGFSGGSMPQRMRRKDPEIVWIQREDVASLIKRAASDECSRWLFEDFDLVSN